MRKMIKLFLVLTAAFALLTAAGCSRKEEDSKYKLYYLNLEANTLVKEPWEPKSEDMRTMADEMAQKLFEAPENTEYQNVFPEEVRLQGYHLENGTVTLDFSSAYLTMDATREILARAAAVQSYIQIPGITGVAITVDGETLKDGAGEEIGAMDADSFVENSGKEINAYQSASLTLYFANESGDKLVEEDRSLYYSTGIPLERIVVEQLIKGTSQEGHSAVLPAETKILGVTTTDGICYVNLDKSFLSSDLSVQEEIPIYAIVNSLSATCGVEAVQISVNGETKVTFRDDIQLSKLFHMDESLIEKEGEDE